MIDTNPVIKCDVARCGNTMNIRSGTPINDTERVKQEMRTYGWMLIEYRSAGARHICNTCARMIYEEVKKGG